MSQDMPDTCLKTSWTLDPAYRLVVAPRIERELTEELAVEVDHTDLLIGDEELDRAALVGPADADFVEAAVVAEADLAERLAELPLDLFKPFPLCFDRAPP